MEYVTCEKIFLYFPLKISFYWRNATCSFLEQNYILYKLYKPGRLFRLREKRITKNFSIIFFKVCGVFSLFKLVMFFFFCFNLVHKYKPYFSEIWRDEASVNSMKIFQFSRTEYLNRGTVKEIKKLEAVKDILEWGLLQHKNY